MYDLIQIAIDGPAAAGKSTVAQNVAALVGGVYINTGDMYRTLTWKVLEQGIDPTVDSAGVVGLLDRICLEHELDAEGRPQLLLDGRVMEQADIRAPNVAEVVSYVARVPEVRHWLVQRQRATRKLGAVVMEGRDIGTVVFPSARFKFYLTASAEIRARRRLDQPGEVADDACIQSVAQDIARRDEIDRTRPCSPLRPAPDAVYIDSSAMTADEVSRKIAERVLA
jgi:cytidylate kinase